VTYLFLDTETTGVRRYRDRVVQLAWALVDDNETVLSEECFVVRPDGFSIPPEAASIHGITTFLAREQGRPLREVLSKFSAAAESADIAVAHNLDFDFGILQHDFDVAGMEYPCNGLIKVCTMKLSAEWCRLPKLNGRPGFKWPKLEELHYRLFGRSFNNAHNALSDVRACRECYFELVRLGVISPPATQRQQRAAGNTQSSIPTQCGQTSKPVDSRSAERDASQFGQLAPLYSQLVRQYLPRESGVPSAEKLKLNIPLGYLVDSDCAAWGDDLISLAANICFDTIK
jgi:DNA polymerase-3 subunit alpha/DNA polymerase-3 subunit epsilon